MGRPRASGARRSLSATTVAPGASTGGSASPSAAPSRAASRYGGSRKTRSYWRAARLAPSRNRRASARRISASSPSPSRLRRIAPIAAALSSTNVARAAPRLSASMPSAPLPANRSRTSAPPTSPRMLNSASRTRSGVGRALAGAWRRRPLWVPAMMRMRSGPELREGSAERRVVAGAELVLEGALDAVDDLASGGEDAPAPVGVDDELGAAVGRVGPARDVTEPLEVVDDLRERLAGQPGPLGERAGARPAIRAQVAQHGVVRRPDVGDPGLAQPVEEVALEAGEGVAEKAPGVRVRRHQFTSFTILSRLRGRDLPRAAPAGGPSARSWSPSPRSAAARATTRATPSARRR